MQEHLIAALRARCPLILCRWFPCEASILGTEEPLSSLVANRRFRLNDPEITSNMVEHQLADLFVA
jgi:hypothetical protein